MKNEETIETQPMNAALMDAACDAVRICSAIQRAHRAVCYRKPTSTQRLAEAQLLSLLADAVKLRDALKGVVS
jgi:hypothetical protein